MSIDVDKIREDVIKMGKDIGEKAKDAAELAKLKVDIASKKRELNQLYAALGRVYFTAHQNDENIPEGVMFRGIRTAEAELAGLKVELESRKDQD